MKVNTADLVKQLPIPEDMAAVWSVSRRIVGDLIGKKTLTNYDKLFCLAMATAALTSQLDVPVDMPAGMATRILKAYNASIDRMLTEKGDLPSEP